MRSAGRIRTWKHDKGFGFIVPDGGGVLSYAHDGNAWLVAATAGGFFPAGTNNSLESLRTSATPTATPSPTPTAT